MKDFLNGYEVVSKREANALTTLFSVYAESSFVDEPMTFGHNNQSDYFYIAFENVNLSIALTPRGDVMFVTFDFENGNEEYFDTEEEAMEYLDTVE
jgi:hypothetical protein